MNKNERADWLSETLSDKGVPSIWAGVNDLSRYAVCKSRRNRLGSQALCQEI